MMQQLPYRDATGNGTLLPGAAGQPAWHASTRRSSLSLLELIKQAQDREVVTAASKIVRQLPPNVLASAAASLAGLPDAVATLAVALCMCRRGVGGRQAGPDPRLDPGLDAVQAQRILDNRRLAAYSKLKGRVAALAEEARRLGLLPGSAVPADMLGAAGPELAASSVQEHMFVHTLMATPAAAAASAGLPAAETQQPLPQAVASSAAATHLEAAFPAAPKFGCKSVRASRAKKGRFSTSLHRQQQHLNSRQLVLLRNLGETPEEALLHWAPAASGAMSPLLSGGGLLTSPLGAVLLSTAEPAGAHHPQHPPHTPTLPMQAPVAAAADARVVLAPQVPHPGGALPAYYMQQRMSEIVAHDIWAAAAGSAPAARSGGSGSSSSSVTMTLPGIGAAGAEHAAAEGGRQGPPASPCLRLLVPSGQLQQQQHQLAACAASMMAGKPPAGWQQTPRGHCDSVSATNGLQLPPLSPALLACLGDDDDDTLMCELGAEFEL